MIPSWELKDFYIFMWISHENLVIKVNSLHINGIILWKKNPVECE